MDEHTFREIDKHMSRELQLIQTMPIKPPKCEWIPIGEYNGVDVPNTYVDENYIVWQKIKCSEYNCEVIYKN